MQSPTSARVRPYLTAAAFREKKRRNEGVDVCFPPCLLSLTCAYSECDWMYCTHIHSEWREYNVVIYRNELVTLNCPTRGEKRKLGQVLDFSSTSSVSPLESSPRFRPFLLLNFCPLSSLSFDATSFRDTTEQHWIVSRVLAGPFA